MRGDRIKPDNRPPSSERSVTHMGIRWDTFLAGANLETIKTRRAVEYGAEVCIAIALPDSLVFGGQLCPRADTQNMTAASYNRRVYLRMFGATRYCYGRQRGFVFRGGGGRGRKS